jgi:uncharacterized membrane protein
MQEIPVQVVVAKFAGEHDAASALQSLKVGRRERLFGLRQAAIVWRDKKAKIHHKDTGDMLWGLIDGGLPSARLQDLGETLLPGSSLLVAVIEHRWVGKIGTTLRAADAEIVIETLRQELEQRWSRGKAVSYAAYKNDQPVGQNGAGGGAQGANEDLAIGDQGVLLRSRVLTRAGVAEREILINEQGIRTCDAPVPIEHGITAGPVSFAELDAESQRRAQSVENDPERRYKLRVYFYNTYGRGQRTAGFGNSELNFMRWEINRGVLAPPDDPKGPGSAWWRAVNGHFCYRAELGVLAAEADLDPQTLPPAVRFWVEYIRKPSSVGWYRAHNGSIAEGYIKYAELACQENVYEQYFMNKVLYRVLYAASMVTGRSFGPLGPLMSNPMLPAVEILVSIPHFYPQRYPVSFLDKMHVLHTGSSLWEQAANILDRWFVLPQLDALYRWSAEWLELPDLPRYAAGQKPIYPFQQS